MIPSRKTNCHCSTAPPARGKSMSQLQVLSLKSDCSLFSRLYVSCQTRGGNLDNFFECENQVAPPSVSHIGTLQPGNKATLQLPILEGVVPGQTQIPVMNTMIIEGSVAVNMLNTGSCKRSIVMPRRCLFHM